jgi:hypothetical protein
VIVSADAPSVRSKRVVAPFCTIDPSTTRPATLTFLAPAFSPDASSVGVT